MIALQRHTLKERMPHSACRELFRNNILHHELSVNLIFMVNFCLISGIRNATLSKREFLFLIKSPSKNKAAIIWKFAHKLVSLQQKHILITYENDNVSLYSIRRV